MSVNNCPSATHQGMPVVYVWRTKLIRQRAIYQEFSVSAVFTPRQNKTRNMA